MEIYLDNAATSHPKPAQVVKAVEAALTTLNGNPGRSGHRRALAGARTLLDCRTALAKLLAAPDPMRITLTANGTGALNLAIKGLLKRGDHVVATSLEHNSVLRPLSKLHDAGLIEWTLVDPEPDGMVDPERMRQALQPNTALCIVTQVSNVLGTVQPVAAIAQRMAEAGVPLLIDGAQALGEVPVSVTALPCALYAFPGHKGLLGPQGTGGLYIAPGLTLDTVTEGGTGSSSESMRQPGEEPDRYESGTVNLPGIAGLLAGATYVQQNGLTIRAHMRARTSQLLEGLARIEGITVYGDLDVRNRTGVVSFNVGDWASGQVADALDRANICVRGGLHCAPGAHAFLGTLKRGAVRASIGHETTPHEIDALLAALYGIAKQA